MSEIETLESVVRQGLAGRTGISVLEAGCGSISHIRLPSGAHVTGIDISAHQLARNTSLSKAVLGDLQEHRWPPGSFDLILCWDVLEHLPQPRAAVERMIEGLKPGGLVVLAIPNLFSVKGLVTRFTPWWFHVAFYRHVIGDRRPADQWDQFPTYLRVDCSPARIRRQASEAGLRILHYRLYEGPVQAHMRQRHRVADWAFAALAGISHLLTLGRFNLAHSDGMLVLQRPPA